MNIQSELKKEGIIEKAKIDILISNSIAKKTAHKIVEKFPHFGLNERNLFEKLSKLDMYRATMTSNLAEASYFYKNSSIYFDENIDIDDLSEFAIHECIHHIQEIKDEKNNLIKMGLCDYSKNSSKPFGLALNEAAVQFMSSEIIGIEPDFEKYYGITMLTPSPSYYPLECALLYQITYFIDKNLLFKSTLFSDNSFKQEFINITSEQFWSKIVTSFDKILKIEDKIISVNNKISELEDGSTKLDKLYSLSTKYKSKLSNEFVTIQNLIIQNFFDAEFNAITNLEQLENYRRKLSKFNEIISTISNYTFFDNYYTETMNKLEHKCNILENGGIETALESKKVNKIFKFFSNLFYNFKKEQET